MNTMLSVIKQRPEPKKEWKKGFDLQDRPVPSKIGDSEVKFKVIASAICGTDVGIYGSKDSLRDSMQGIPYESIIVGHEFCGKIVDSGKGAREHLAALIGSTFRNDQEYLPENFLGKSKRELAAMPDFLDVINEHFFATAEMHVTCGKCVQCLRNEKHVCAETIIKGIHEDGCFTSYVTTPVENAVLFGKNEIPPEVIAFMDAIGNAVHTVQAADVKGKNIAILGCGVQGLMAIAAAKYAGAERIFATDASHGKFTHEKLLQSRFKLAKSYGAEEIFDVSISDEKERFYDRMLEETKGAGVDAVLEMSGNYKAYEDAFRVVRMGGTLALLGIPGGKMVVDFSKDIIFRGVTVHGVIGRRVFETWEVMRKYLRSGMADNFISSGFVTHDLPIREVESGIDAIANGDGLKVLLRPT